MPTTAKESPAYARKPPTAAPSATPAPVRTSPSTAISPARFGAGYVAAPAPTRTPVSVTA